MADSDSRPTELSASTAAFSRCLVDLTEEIAGTRRLTDAAAVVAAYAGLHLGAEPAGVAVREPARPTVRLAATDPVLARLDAVEDTLDQLPDLDGSRAGAVVTIGDTRVDPRWPAWSAAAAELQLLSVHLVAMPTVRGRPMTLELFSRRPHAFTSDRALRAGLLARHAGHNLRHIDRTANLVEAMHTREVIGQAQGIVMERYGLTSVQAMNFLRRSSQQSQVRIRALAEQMVAARDSGFLPDLSAPRLERDEPAEPA
jgi:hypothetical protein